MSFSPLFPICFIKFVALILLLSRGIKRLTGIKVAVGGGDRIQVLSRAVLSSKAKVYLLQVEGKRILVGESGGQIRSLCSYTVPQEESSEARTTEMGAADQDREVFRSSLESSQTGRKNRGFVDRVMAGIRDLRREKLKLTRSDVSTIRPRRENPTN